MFISNLLKKGSKNLGEKSFQQKKWWTNLVFDFYL